MGIYEEFDETMVMLKHFLGFTNVFYNHTKAVHHRPKAAGFYSPFDTQIILFVMLSAF